MADPIRSPLNKKPKARLFWEKVFSIMSTIIYFSSKELILLWAVRSIPYPNVAHKFSA